MRIAGFYHSLRSDWNHGNAHFLRGIAWDLRRRGHDVDIYEPHDAWSARCLEADHGPAALRAYERAYPGLRSTVYDLDTIDLDVELEGTDLVLVHEWNDPALVAAVGRWRRRQRRACVLFHDTHHRSLTRPGDIAAFDLEEYDGVLAFGEAVRDRYERRGWSRRSWTWHEAADVRVFGPRPGLPRTGDLVWIGNWGDGERTRELQEFLLEPVRTLELAATIHGVRYPATALRRLSQAGCTYEGYLPNHKVPDVFARHAVTVHVPRRIYASRLPGVPTIRPFEAMACGIPLVSAPWDDADGLFTAGHDYVPVCSTQEAVKALRELLGDRDYAEALAAHGRRTVLSRHTCVHRVDELLRIHETIAGPDPGPGVRRGWHPATPALRVGGRVA